MLATTETVPVFGMDDLCDRCSQRPQFVAVKDDKVLLFCGHHKNEFAPDLFQDGWRLEKAQFN